SFVTTTKPKSSLNHNLKSVPWALTGDTLSAAGKATLGTVSCCRERPESSAYLIARLRERRHLISTSEFLEAL
ncbi:hypothetical protein, partial [Paracoccus kondratievae]|uniref:hypothetical protein n=1 Tax=Paracoccus kondratievae TaxID=135740 RepID=UPI0022F2703F